MKPFLQPSSAAATVMAWVGFVVWMAAIFWLSSLQGPQLEQAFEWIPGDKFAHFVAFAAGAMLLWSALHRSLAQPNGRVALSTVLAIALFGALDEWHQLHTPMRSGGDFGDWLADALGATFGVLGCLFVHARLRRIRLAPRAVAEGD